MKVLRVQCECGRNLADVTVDTVQRVAGAPDHLVVTSRPNVRQPEYRPNLSLVSGITYTWPCRCRRIHQRRHERIGAVWREHEDDSGRVVVVVLGVDL